MTNIVSLFASSYVYHWPDFFPEKKLLRPPAFDARVVLYPTNRNLRDYLSWRQADCHINNLYNTVFWTLIQKGGLSNQEAEKRLSGTFSSDKNEILFSQFGINYNNESDQFKKGTVLYWKKVDVPVDPVPEQSREENSKRNLVTTKKRTKLLVEFRDIIGETFWSENQHLIQNFQDS